MHYRKVKLKDIERLVRVAPLLPSQMGATNAFGARQMFAYFSQTQQMQMTALPAILTLPDPEPKDASVGGADA